jgi:hypothetical protein
LSQGINHQPTDLTAMSRWRYTKIDISDLPRKTEDIDLLDDLGADGWGLIQINVNGIA